MDGVIAASEPVRRLHPAVTRFAGRIVCPDAQVEPHEDDVEIQAEAETPVCGQVAGQAGEAAPGLQRITQVPDIDDLGENGTVKLPEKREAKFSNSL